MGLSNSESYLDFKRRVLDSVSQSFCAAKWWNATIWLNSGTTASCHHPPPHKIDLAELKKNPSALHNTKLKMEARKEMLRGVRPAECEYCWKIEDLGPTQISDRVFKSKIYGEDSLFKLPEQGEEKTVNPRQLEIAFDRNCQFSCMYCSPSFSSSWAQEIMTHGSYRGLNTDKRRHYLTTHDWAASTRDNPYVQAFWDWWPSLSQDLEQLRITGGEPLMSPDFWKLLEVMRAHSNPGFRFAINSNLGAESKLIEKLLRETESLPHFEIYTSGEAFGPSAEYIRDGLVWERWCENMVRILNTPNVKRLHIMMTINGLCLFSITEFLDQVRDWKLQFQSVSPTISVNILRHPTFQSPLVLPKELRLELAESLEAWCGKNLENSFFVGFERESLSRLIVYLRNEEYPTADRQPLSDLQHDLKHFLVQYDRRRQKSYRASLPKRAVKFLDEVSLEKSADAWT